MKVGEIIGVTTTTLSAQSYELNNAPPFGALLKVRRDSADSDTDDGRHAGPLTYYALCYGAQTDSIDAGRHAVAWGRFEDDDDDIYRRQPQLSQVLHTTFDALVVGYAASPRPSIATGDGDAQRVVQRIPATPPRLHAVVYLVDADETAAFNRDISYLRFVLRAGVPNADDFIAAVIDHAYRAAGCDRGFLVTTARTVARLLGGEHERVMSIMELLDG